MSAPYLADSSDAVTGPDTVADLGTAARRGRTDVFTLTRALVFTKEAYRTLRSRGRDARPSPARNAAPEAAGLAAAGPRRVGEAPAPARVLTPWDLIDEDPSPAGVTFTVFQQRPRASRLHLQRQHQQAA
jgi:hypothetical protein